MPTERPGSPQGQKKGTANATWWRTPASGHSCPNTKSVSIRVSGWKKRLLPGSPAELSGEAWLTLGLNKTVVTLQGAEADGPRFVLYFSATPAE